jgi:hypothetical protein
MKEKNAARIRDGMKRDEKIIKVSSKNTLSVSFDPALINKKKSASARKVESFGGYLQSPEVIFMQAAEQPIGGLLDRVIGRTLLRV